jgi:hypothetical protein
VSAIVIAACLAFSAARCFSAMAKREPTISANMRKFSPSMRITKHAATVMSAASPSVKSAPRARKATMSGAAAAATRALAALPRALRQNAQAAAATQTATSARADSTRAPCDVAVAAISETANATAGPRTLAPATLRRTRSSVALSTLLRALSQKMRRNVETAISAAGRTIPSMSEVREVAQHSAAVVRMTTPWT